MHHSNWHVLMPLDAQTTAAKVVQAGARERRGLRPRVLDEMATARNILVINDEAHHAWRDAPKTMVKDVTKEEIERRRKWVGAWTASTAHAASSPASTSRPRPSLPPGKRVYRGDALRVDRERLRPQRRHRVGAGQDPRVVIRDDGKLRQDYKSRLYHIYRAPG